VQKATERYDIASLEGKEQFLRSLIPYINIIQSDTRKESCIQVLAEKLEVDYQSVSRDIQRWGRGTDRGGTVLPADSPRDGISTQLFLLLAVAVFREYFVEVRQELTVDDFTDQEARDLFIALEECHRAGESSFDSLLEKLEESDVKSLVLAKSGSAEFYQNTEQIIRDAVDSIRKGSIEKKRRKIERLLREYEEEGRDLREVKDLLNEKIYYDRELERLKGTMHE
jgi:DNA primase